MEICEISLEDPNLKFKREWIDKLSHCVRNVAIYLYVFFILHENRDVQVLKKLKAEMKLFIVDVDFF